MTWRDEDERYDFVREGSSDVGRTTVLERESATPENTYKLREYLDMEGTSFEWLRVQDDDGTIYQIWASDLGETLSLYECDVADGDPEIGRGGIAFAEDGVRFFGGQFCPAGEP